MNIISEIKNIKSSPKELREFGLTLGILSAVLGALLLALKLFLQGSGALKLFHWQIAFQWFFMMAILFILPAILAPSILKPFQKAWMSLSVILGWVMSHLLLAVIFYFVMTPIGFLARLVGKDFLNSGKDSLKSSYWISREEDAGTKTDYEKQF